MSDFNSQVVTRDDCIREYQNHMSDHSQGYFKTLNKFATQMAPLVGGSPFSREAWSKILDNDALFKKALTLSSEVFAGNDVLTKRFQRLMNNTRDIANSVDRNGFGIEGWGGGTAVYASSQGTFAMGATPFIIGGWMAAARSEEIYQHIDNKNKMRLEFEYNIDYLQVGDVKYFFPQAFRSGEIVGFNKLPKVDWVTPNTATGTGLYTKPENWCGEKMFILLNPVADAPASVVKGNLLKVCKKNVHKYGIEPNCKLTSIKYKDGSNGEVEKKIHLNYDVSTGKGGTNERIFKSDVVLKDVQGQAQPIVVHIVLQVNIDTGDFILLSSTNDPNTNKLILGFQFDGKISNEANELTNIPTTGTDKYEFIRECEYRNYAKVSLNEYMADNFRIGTNNNISYVAYATDKMLQYTVFNRELEGEQFFINEVLDDTIDLDYFELTHKMGGFINNNLSFTIGRFTPGMQLQDYKEGLKTYLTKVLATAETDLNLPASVKREWILLGYDALIAEFPEIKYENAAVDLTNDPDGKSAANENYGFSIGNRKLGYTDSLGRGVRFIANNDSRWRNRHAKIFGALRTYSMEYPFLVYYPHAIRMFTAIDADMPNRTAIYIGGREYRGHFAGGAIELTLNGVLAGDGSIVNNFDAQMADAKGVYKIKTT